MENRDIITLGELAQYLKLGEKTVLGMAKRSEIPGAKVGSQWRFMHSMIDDWLISRMKVIPQTDVAAIVEAGTDILPISRLILNDFVLMDVKPGSREEVLRQLVSPLVQKGIVKDGERFIGKLLEREEMASTAIGSGIAIPHLRHPQENPYGVPDLVVGICREGTEFMSLDKKKTYLFFLLCTDSEVVHVRVMAKLATFLRQSDVVTRLVQAADSEEVVKILIEADNKLLRV